MEKKVALIFQEPTGVFICADDAPMLDARGARYSGNREAIASLRDLAREGQTDYTHYRVSGNPRDCKL